MGGSLDEFIKLIFEGADDKNGSTCFFMQEIS